MLIFIIWFLQFTALECLHNADILHNDIKLNNLAFGTEKAPTSGVRSEGIMYDDDVFLFGKLISTDSSQLV